MNRSGVSHTRLNHAQILAGTYDVNQCKYIGSERYITIALLYQVSNKRNKGSPLSPAVYISAFCYVVWKATMFGLHVAQRKDLQIFYSSIGIGEKRGGNDQLPLHGEG